MKRTLTSHQTYHYLLSFSTHVLIEWYNTYIIDPFGDYREQIIRQFTAEEEAKVKNTLSIETLINLGQNPATKIDDCSHYFCLTGGDKPYLISFNTFEEFLDKIPEEEKDAFLDSLSACPDSLDELELTAFETEKKKK